MEWNGINKQLKELNEERKSSIVQLWIESDRIMASGGGRVTNRLDDDWNLYVAFYRMRIEEKMRVLMENLLQAENLWVRIPS